MQLPEKFLQSLQGIKGFERDAFERLHASGEQVTSIRINPAKWFGFQNLKLEFLPIPWSRYGCYLHERPSFTFDPFFHAGCYYVQEASGMFLEHALKQTTDLSRPIRILDLSAAPGGKSTHIQSLISNESLLVSNEVIRSRANILKDNIIKWGCGNVIVTNNDPKDFSLLENYFDVIVVDAPCSGSGLFRREPLAIDEWSENNVILCSQRQQRILADVIPSLKKNGVLIYSTCSYSGREDEDILDWLTAEFKMESMSLHTEREWNIVEVESNGSFGYRFWPDKLKGEGFFIGCLKKTEGEEEADMTTRSKPGTATKKETEIVEKWAATDDHRLIKNENTIYAWPESLENDMSFILSSLRVLYSGVRIGELIRDKLIPDHALSMSRIVNDSIASVELDYEQAIRYLQRKDIQIDSAQKGWGLVKYEGHSLGWINVLPNRINNYYPKELRILKG